MSFKKKLIMTSAAYLLPITAFSIPASFFYGGVQGGVDALMVERNTTSAYLFPPPALPNETFHFRDTDLGAVGGIYFGYDQKINQYFDIALEASGDIDNSEARVYGTNIELLPLYNTDFREKLRSDAGLSLLPGISIGEAKIYGKFGVHRGKFEYSSLGNTTDDRSYNGNFTEWLTGYGTGLGAAINLTSQMELRLEYDHIVYGNVTRAATDPISLSLFQDTVKFQPTSNLVLVGLDYKIPLSN